MERWCADGRQAVRHLKDAERLNGELQQLYLHSGQQPDAASLVAALATLPPAVTASATSAITFGLIVSGFILRLLGPRRSIPTTSSDYGLQSG